MLVIGQTVTVRLPDAELQLTMDQAKIELRRAAEKLKNLGVKPTGFEGFEDLFGGKEDWADKFGDIDAIFNGKKK